jgi:hypothetical protein
MCALVLRETGPLPHINPGGMSRSEMAGLRMVSASQGIMLESLNARLCEPGGVHYGSPARISGEVGGLMLECALCNSRLHSNANAKTPSLAHRSAMIRLKMFRIVGSGVMWWVNFHRGGELTWCGH